MTKSRGIHKALKARPALTAETVKTIFDYNALTGALLWKIHSAKCLPGSRAGSPDNTGRWKVGYKGKDYLISRIAWLYMYGEWPKYDIDHIDLDCGNDSIANLRDIPHSQNMANTRVRRNNKLGVKGVTRDHQRYLYRAEITQNGVNKHLGRFETIEEAKAAYDKAAAELFGEAARS